MRMSRRTFCTILASLYRTDDLSFPQIYHSR
jgi:hypothetical protein